MFGHYDIAALSAATPFYLFVCYGLSQKLRLGLTWYFTQPSCESIAAACAGVRGGTSATILTSRGAHCRTEQQECRLYEPAWTL